LITLFAWRIRVGHSVGHMFEIAATRPLIERISAIHSRLSYRIVRYCRYHLGLPFLVHAFAIFALLLFTIATALESGVWKTAEHCRGPFRTADNATGMVIVPVARELPLRPIVSARSDSVIFGSQSDLTLRVNGESWGSVRDNPPSRFTHWNGYLHVKLPPQLPNDATTTFDVEYSVRLHPYVLNSRWIILLALALEFWLFIRTAPRNAAAAAKRTQWLVFPLFLFTATILVACAVYLLTIILGIWLGHALPTATL